jgi:cell division protein FtsL
MFHVLMVSDFKKKQKAEFFTINFWLKTAGIFILIAVLALLFTDFKIYQKRQQLISQIDAYKKQIEEIKKRNESLKEQITKSDDKDYIEKIAREELDMQKEGEKVVSFIMPEQKPAAEAQNGSFWSANFWFGWIGQSWQWIKGRF